MISLALLLSIAAPTAYAQTSGGSLAPNAAAQETRFFNSWFHDPTRGIDDTARPTRSAVEPAPPAPILEPARPVAAAEPARSLPVRSRAGDSTYPDTAAAERSAISAAYVPSIAQPSGPVTQGGGRPAPAVHWPESPPLAQQTPGLQTSADDYVDGIYIFDTDYWLGYPKHVYKMVTAPARFDRNDWLLVGGLVAGAGALFALDENIQDFWQDHISGGTGSDILGVFEPLGRTWPVVYGSAGVYAVAEAAQQLGGWNFKREKAAALLTIESVLISQVITTGIKELSGRARPNNSDDAFQFDGPGNGKSFPSGHATVAFAVATTLSNIYGKDHKWVPWIAYPVATGTALSRIDDNKHWASDVFVGALIGYAVAKTATLFNPFLEENRIAIRPLRGGPAQGAAVVVGF